MKVELWPLARVIPYARNPRKNDAAVAKVAASIKEFGWQQPIVVDPDGVIVAGHTRLLAARQLQLEKVPVKVARGLTPEQIKAYRLADNRSHEESEWDDELLALELQELLEADFDLGLTAFDDKEIDQLLKHGTVGLTDPDDAPPPPAHPVSRRGDVWILGNHRLMCGDSTEAECVAALLGNVRPHLMVTDPPYGVEYDPAWRKRAGVGGDGVAVGEVLNDDRADWRAAWELFPGHVAYVWHAGLTAPIVHRSLEAVHFRVRAHIVWVKQRAALSRGHYHWQHEECLYAVQDDADDDCWRFVPEHELAMYAVKNGTSAEWNGGRKQSTVWHIEALKNDTGHSTQKPVECMRRPIENNSSPGQAVYDPFVGSGTTIIAAETCGRCCLAMELSPAHVDVAVRRWQAFTGREAILEVSREPFERVARDRDVQVEEAEADGGG